jgi:hypothetical protein
MPDDSIQHAVDDDRVRALFILDHVNFMTHWLAVAVLASLYWARTPEPRLFIAWMGFYAAAIFAAGALWIWHGRAQDSLSPHGWMKLHALGNVILAAAGALSIWLAFVAPGAGFPHVYAVLLSVVAMVLLMATGFDALNFSSAIPWVLLPFVCLYPRIPSSDWVRLALVCAFVGVFMCVFVWRYRQIYRRAMKARADQQHMARLLAQQNQIAEQASLARSESLAAASRDLRDPLHAIGLLAGSLSDTQSTPDQRARCGAYYAAGRDLEPPVGSTARPRSDRKRRDIGDTGALPACRTVCADRQHLPSIRGCKGARTTDRAGQHRHL